MRRKIFEDEKTLFQKIRFTGRNVLCCFCKQFNEKSTISISSWSSLRKRKRLPCHGPVLLPFRLFSWIHICDSTRLSEDKPGKKYFRSDNTMFIQRNLNWHDKIFAFFHIYETNLLSIRKRIDTLSFFHYLGENTFDMIDYDISKIMTNENFHKRIRHNVIV